MLNFNFQSIKTKQGQLYNLLDTCSTKPDIIFGTETWLDPSIKDSQIFPPGYNIFRNDRLMRDSTRGVHRRRHTEPWQWTTNRLPHHGLLKGLKVSHSLIIHKLDQYGIKWKTNAWIKGFLTDRTQGVVIEGEKSGIMKVESGVPQGSILRQSLFHSIRPKVECPYTKHLSKGKQDHKIP